MAKKPNLATKADHRKALESMVQSQKLLLAQMKALFKAMQSKPPVKERAPTQSVRVTPAVEAMVHEMVKKNPTMPNSKIAHRVNINPGRVSEIIAKRRK